MMDACLRRGQRGRGGAENMQRLAGEDSELRCILKECDILESLKIAKIWDMAPVFERLPGLLSAK